MNLFSSRALVAIFGIGILTFLFGLVLSAFSGEVFGELSSGSNSYSRSLVGHQALVEFFKQSGLAVVVSRNPTTHQLKQTFPLLLLEPVQFENAPQLFVEDPNESKETKFREQNEQVRQILQAAIQSKTPVVLALPKWASTPAFLQAGWIQSQTLVPIAPIADLLKVALSTGPEDLSAWLPDEPVKRPSELTHIQTILSGLNEPKIELESTPQLIAPFEGLEPFVWCDQGVLVGRLSVEQLGRHLILISDPDLLNNRGLALGDHAALLHSLLAGALQAEGLIVDETLHGFTSRGSLLAWILSFPLVLLVIHLLLTLALASWSFSQRFGKVIPPPPELQPGKHLLIENTASLLLSGGDHADAVRRYLKITIGSVAQRFSLPEGMSIRELLPHLEALNRARGVSVDLEKIIEATRTQTLKPNEAIRIANQIHRWQQTLTGIQSMEG